MRWQYGQTIWRCAPKAFAGAGIIFRRLWYADCVDYTLVGIFGGSDIGCNRRFFTVFKLLNKKRDRENTLSLFVIVRRIGITKPLVQLEIGKNTSV